MCNHVYTANYKHLPPTIGKECPYPKFYEEVRSRGNRPFPALPLDDCGTCIFHSQDVVWKKNHNFEGRFLELLRLLVDDTGAKYHDFAEFVFIGTGSAQQAFNLVNMALPKQAYFTAAHFIDSVNIEGVNFQEGADFQMASFEGNLQVTKSRFNGFYAAGAEFHGLVWFTDVDTESYAYFHSARFTGASDGYVIKFENSLFNGITDFSGAKFLLGDESTVGFLRTRFAGSANFTRAEFQCHLVYSDASFAGTTEFVDTSFNTVVSSARYRGSAVEFNRIDVSVGAVLVFESTDPQRKLFNHDVQISFNDAPAGLLRFRNVNFYHFSAASRANLNQLATSGRVDIGVGCIKYRFQTEIRKVSIIAGNAQLVLELCQTFTYYFTASNGFNLGFEVVERTKAHLVFFYFTDEDISEAIFRDRLAGTEYHLWSLLSIRSEDQLLDIDSSASMASVSQTHSAVLNAVDGVTALLGTFFRVGIRIALGMWKEADTKALLGAIRFNDEGADLRAQSLHQVLVDRYTGRTLLEFNGEQNGGLPPAVLQYREEPSVEVIDVAIVTAIEVERRAVCDVFGLTTRVRRDARVYWRGKLSLGKGEAYELVVAQAPDAANIDSAILTNDLLHHWRPGAALLIGIAASAEPTGVHLGDVVLGSEVYYYERGKVTSDGVKLEPKLISADATLWANVTSLPDWDASINVARPDGTDVRPKIHAGVIASGEKVVADANERGRVAIGHRKIIAIEMEGYGFSRAVWQSFDHVRHLDIRAICDDGSRDKNDHWHRYAAAAAAGFAKHFLLDRPLEPKRPVGRTKS